MAHVQTITVTAARKATRDYQTRDFSVTFEVALDLGDNPRDQAELYSRRAQYLVDQALGDSDSQHAHLTHSRLGAGGKDR